MTWVYFRIHPPEQWKGSVNHSGSPRDFADALGFTTNLHQFILVTTSSIEAKVFPLALWYSDVFGS